MVPTFLLCEKLPFRLHVEARDLAFSMRTIARNEAVKPSIKTELLLPAMALGFENWRDLMTPQKNSLALVKG